MAVPPEVLRELEAALSEWWESVVTEERIIEPEGADAALYDSMPVLDSKRVFEAAPIFERILEVQFDTRWIRSNGYNSLESMIADIVPKAMAAKPVAPDSGAAR